MKARRVALALGGSLLAAGLYAVAVFPTQAIIRERDVREQQAVALARVQEENTALSHQIAKLNDPAYIEEIAREDYGMYPKGSTPYQILPSSPLYHS